PSNGRRSAAARAAWIRQGPPGCRVPAAPPVSRRPRAAGCVCKQSQVLRHSRCDLQGRGSADPVSQYSAGRPTVTDASRRTSRWRRPTIMTARDVLAALVGDLKAGSPQTSRALPGPNARATGDDRARLDAWLSVAIERSAADLLLVAGAPPSIRVNGVVMP